MVNGGDSIDILKSVRKPLVGFEDDGHFDAEIIMHINTVFMVLTQLGVGPPQGFSISEDNPRTWDEFIQDKEALESVKTYIFIRVRLLFDPPTNSFLIDALERTAKELEWRLNVEEGGTLIG